MDQRAAMATMVVVGRAVVVLVLLALCALHPAASAADIVWGSSSTFTQKAAGGDRYLAMCESMRLGSELAFNATNARSDRMGVLASRNLVTLFLDDNRNNTATALNTNALLARSDDDLLGLLVTSDGEGAATAFLSMTGQAIDSVPFVGPWSGLGLLQSPFKRWVFNTLPTSFQSLTYAIAKFLANDRLLSRFALLYPHPSLISGVDIRAGVEAKLALLGYRLASHYGVPSFSADPQTIGAAVANISAGEPQAVIMVVSSGQTSAFIKAAKAAMTRDDVIYILDGSVSNNITDDLTTERERENVYLVFPVPLLSDTDLPIVRDFWADRDAHAPGWRQVVQPGALEGYINARWIVSVLEGMREPLNRAAFIDAVYSTPIRHVGGVAMGPFYDDCARTGCQACCNAGSRRIYLVQFPNGTLEYVPDSVLEWQSCFPQPGDVRLPFKFGESVALTGEDARSGVAVRNGLASSFGATNAAAAFNGRNMVLIGYDDQSRPEENAGSNYEQLVELDNVLALTGLRGIEAIAAALNHSSNAPVIGVSTGSPTLNSIFDRRLVRVAGSAYEELAGALDYFVGRLGFSLVGLYYESTPDGRLTLKGLVKALALRNLILAASVEQGDAVPTSGVELWLVYNPSGELVAPFLDSLSSGGVTATPVCVLSSLDPDLLVDRINATSSASFSTFHAPRSQAQLAVLHFTQSLPNPNPNPAAPAANGSGTQLAASFRAALAALDPNARPSYAGLSGYVSGRLLAALISTINGQVTGDSLLSALYASGVIELDDLSLGVYYDRCNATGIPCCNAGSRSVHVVTPDGNANGTWSTQHTFDYDQCTFTFDADSADSGDGRSREEVLGIALGVALPVAALLVCCLVLVGLVALVASRRAAAARGLQEYTIDFDELELDGVLGQGGFGEVHKAVWKGTEVAVKLMPQGNVTREARQNFVDEVDIMSRLRHPNVILFMAASVKPPRLCIVMEYMELGSLYDLIHNELVPELPLLLKVKLVHQAAKGMHFLHSSEIVHRDLKSLNLLLDHKWNLKVADFGLTKFKDALLRQDSRDRDHAVVGSVPWMAPEVLGDEGRDQIDFVLADVYSFGIVLWELLTREVLYEGMLPAQIAIRVIREDMRPALSGHALDEAAHPRSAGEARYVELMRSCWKRDPTERPTFDEIITRLEGVKSAAGGGGTGTSSARQSTSSASSSPTASGTLPRSNYASTGTTTSSEGRPFDLHLRNVPRRDVSYAVCDLARMDELWQRDPFAAERTAESYGSLVRAQAAAHSGFIFSRPSLHSGGTYMLSFATTQAAAAFALALVAAVNDAGGDDGQLHQRSLVALHHQPKTNGRLPGDYAGATYEPNHYQEACRINLLGWPGAVLCSAAFRDACGGPDDNSAGVHLHNLPGREYSLLVGPDGDGDALAAAQDTEAEPERRGGLCSSNQCPWIIDGRRLTEGEWLGQGSYGQVTAGSYLGMPVAVKRLFNSKLDDDSMRRMRREAALLFNLEHPNLVKLVGLSIGDDAQLSLVMELVPGGSLGALLADSSRKLSWAARLSVLRDAALGLAYLHEHGVIHRDIKSSNLLVDDELGGAGGGGLRVKVADFGFATAKQENATMTRCGTPAWTAPEVLLPPQPAAGGGSGGGDEERHEAALLEKADVYSFGVVMWEVLTRKVPYQDNGNDGHHHHYNLGHLIQAVLDGKRPVVPSDCPPAFAKLMKRCWHRNPRKRPDMDQVLLSLNQLSGTCGP